MADLFVKLGSKVFRALLIKAVPPRPVQSDEDYPMVPTGDRVDCQYYVPAHVGEAKTPFCTRFQISPLCGGDLEICDIGMNSPDPRSGYR